MMMPPLPLVLMLQLSLLLPPTVCTTSDSFILTSNNLQRCFLNNCPTGPSSSSLSCFHSHGQRQSLHRRRRRRQRRPETSTCLWNRRNHSQSSRCSSCSEKRISTHLALAMIPPKPAKNDDPLAPPSTKQVSAKTPNLIQLGSIIMQQICTVTHSKQSKGRLYLLLVSFLYGTLNSTLRAVYAMDGKPVPSALSFVRQMLSVVTFLPMLFLVRTNSALNKKVAPEDEEGVVLLSLSKKDINFREKGRPIWRSALELAFWNFGAQVRREKC